MDPQLGSEIFFLANIDSFLSVYVVSGTSDECDSRWHDFRPLTCLCFVTVLLK